MLGADGRTRISGTVLEFVPEARWVHPARLLVTLEPTASGTRVGLVHDGFAGIGTPDWNATLEAYERGADKHEVLQQLALERSVPRSSGTQVRDEVVGQVLRIRCGAVDEGRLAAP